MFSIHNNKCDNIMKKLLFILTLFLSFVAAAQPGPVNKYNTRVRYWLEMADSLQGFPKDTFNLRTTWAINNGWNNYPWIASKGDSSYMWSIRQQKWIQTTSKSQLASTVTIINDSSIQICDGNNICDTFVTVLPAPVVTNVTVINDSTILLCVNNSCDTIVTHITVNPPITSTTILNDSTIIVCNANGCDTLVIHTVTPPITSTTILNDSTIIVCNAGGCDTIVIHPDIITTTVINDSTIQICGVNSCDTIVFNSPITNITILSDTTVQVCGSNILGPQQITNGGFIGNANGWQLGSLWAYGSNNIIHSFGSAQPTAQAGTLVEGATYVVSADIGGSTGTIDLKLDAGTTHTYVGGAGAVQFTGTWNNANNYAIVLTPSTDFDGSVTNVSVRQILPNCDTLQVPPTLFIPTDTFYVKNTLYSTGVGVTNHDTVYSSQAGRFDSGHLSMEDWRYFNHKVDSLYYHSSIAGIDSFLYNNGDTTGVFWYANDVNPNGLISGGQVLPSGTPYVFNITSAVYRINGIRYTSPPTQVTIPTADPSLPRTDRFVVDTSGNATVIIGTAANPNLAPSIDVAWQLSLTTVDLPAANPPQIVDSLIFNENVAPEWIPVTNQGTTTNANNTVNPWLGTKSVDVTNINAGDVIIFTYTGTFDLTPFVVANGSVTGFILLKAPIPSTATIRVQFFNGGAQVSPLVALPLVKNNITTYQGFSIPLSNFSLSGNTVTILRFQYVNTTNTNYAGFWLDDINLQSGIQPPVPVTTTNIVAYNALTHVKNNNIDSIKLGGSQTENTIINNNGFAFTHTGDIYVDSLTIGRGGGAIISNTALGKNALRQNTTGTLNVAVGDSALTSNTTGVGNTAVGWYAMEYNNTGSVNTAIGRWALQFDTSGSNNIAIGNNALANGHSQSRNVAIGNSSQGNNLTGTDNTTVGHSSGINSQLTGGNFNLMLGSGVSVSGAINPTTSGNVDIGSRLSLSAGGPMFPQSITMNLNNNVLIGDGGNTATSPKIYFDSLGKTYLIQYDSVHMNGGNLATDSVALITNSGLIRKVSPSAFATAPGAAQTLQQTFNTEVGGSVLTKVDSIQAGSFSIHLYGTAVPIQVYAIGSTAIYGETDNTNGVYGAATASGGYGVRGNSIDAYAIYGQSQSGVAFGAQTNNSSNNTVAPVVDIIRVTSGGGGAGANGIGGSIDFRTLTTTSANSISNQIISKWTDATNATRTSQLSITGVDAGTTRTLVTMDGNGSISMTGAGTPSTTLTANNTTGNGVAAFTTSGVGISSVTTTGIPAFFVAAPTSTNSVVELMQLERDAGGSTPANGLGGDVRFVLQTSDLSGLVANRIISEWTDATTATATSKFTITGRNGGTAGNVLVISGDGSTQMPKYGAGAATFDASGNITSVSDVRLKDIQGSYNGGLNELMNVNPIIYKWNEKSGMEMKHDYIGFSAQNIQSALGENAIGINRDGYLSIQDRAILATLVNAIKEQQKEIEELRLKLNEK